MRDYEELVTRVGGIALGFGLLEPSLRDVSLHSDNEPDFALAMWLERLNRGGHRLSDELLAELDGWLPADPPDEDLESLLAENRALAA